MANPLQKVQSNIEGNYYVDTTCINCDTCRQLAASVFKDNGSFSYVYRQPESAQDKVAATRALLCCPTGSIGSESKLDFTEIIDNFPIELEENVYYCGFNSAKSFGASSYFIKDACGNWLIDSPRFQSNLVKKFEQMGGIKYIFLTHKDDVADARKYAALFGAKRIIHQFDSQAQLDAEIILNSDLALNNSKFDFAFYDNINDNKAILSDSDRENTFTIIYTPGHTKGHLVLLYKNKFLFTGDSLGFDSESNSLDANKEHCWYSFSEQVKSIEALLKYKFQWILPGHGHRKKFDSIEAAHLKIKDFILKH